MHRSLSRIERGMVADRIRYVTLRVAVWIDCSCICHWILNWNISVRGIACPSRIRFGLSDALAVAVLACIVASCILASISYFPITAVFGLSYLPQCLRILSDNRLIGLILPLNAFFNFVSWP